VQTPAMTWGLQKAVSGERPFPGPHPKSRQPVHRERVRNSDNLLLDYVIR
jgi:hypothetical protein